MKFGLRLIGYLGNTRELVRLAVLGEQAGFDYVWFPHDTFMGNTWVITSAENPTAIQYRFMSARLALSTWR
jgi:alkanesulfonate monooxygenase SsuD/methylene tetrahydromethanopterin reductase-like flavin-dependent oxidoreductase (luciferase family)